MTELEERVERAARILCQREAIFDWDQGSRGDQLMLETDALEILRAAFPELFAGPPTAWIAPWEATDVMVVHAANLIGIELGDEFEMESTEANRQSFALMRDAHLRQPTPPNGRPIP